MTFPKQTLLLFSFIALQTYGQNDKTPVKHPIDVQLEKCHSIDSNQTTSGMMDCEAIAQEEWDLEMNKYFRLLVAILPSKEKTGLKAAQTAWLNYRDKEKEFCGGMYYNMQGTMWRVVAAGRSCTIIRQRALELKGYYEMLTFDK